MIELDTDLRSRQNARVLVRNAKKAQAIMATFSQQQIDAIVKNVAQEAAHHAEALAKMAAEETGFGNWQDKVLKNRFASLRVYDAIKDMKTGAVTETGLPASNVLYYDLNDGAWVCVRPSGTEPKVKFYIGVKGSSMEEAEQKYEVLGKAVLDKINKML